MLPDGWHETTITGPTAPERVYRKAAGDLVLTLCAEMADRNGGDELDAFFEREWAQFLDVKRRHA